MASSLLAAKSDANATVSKLENARASPFCVAIAEYVYKTKDARDDHKEAVEKAQVSKRNV